MRTIQELRADYEQAINFVGSSDSLSREHQEKKSQAIRILEQRLRLLEDKTQEVHGSIRDAEHLGKLFTSSFRDPERRKKLFYIAQNFFRDGVKDAERWGDGGYEPSGKVRISIILANNLAWMFGELIKELEDKK